MPKYCIVIDGDFHRAYVKQLARLPVRVNVRYIQDILPAYIAIRCSARVVKIIYETFAWIKCIQTYDPAPVFWDDWSEEENSLF